jgi:hypothetical protein
MRRHDKLILNAQCTYYQRTTIMNPLLYLKAVVGAVGANVFPPLAEWAVSYIPNAPSNVRTALSVLIVALLTGGAVYTTPNTQPSGVIPNTPARTA